MNKITLGRKKDNQWLGVCQGLADHFKIDPFYIRLIFACLTIFAGKGLLLYWIAWVIMPYHPEDKTT